MFKIQNSKYWEKGKGQANTKILALRHMIIG